MLGRHRDILHFEIATGQIFTGTTASVATPSLTRLRRTGCDQASLHDNDADRLLS
jgi:hypothetical protein